MNGIKMSDCKFYVDEDARTVVCVIPKTGRMLRDYISDHFSWDDVDFDSAVNYGAFTDILEMPKSFRGKAVCAKEDEWNEETGRMIAFSRAKDKCYKSFYKRAKKFALKIDSRLGDVITKFNDMGYQLEERHKELTAKIEERIK